MSQSDAEVRLAPAIPEPEFYHQHTFELTLLDLPSLPVSLIRQIGNLLRDRREPSRREQPEARLRLSDPRPWIRELPSQIQALLAMRNAAPARFTSRVVDVPDIWQDYLPNPYSWANSLLIHLFALTLILLPFAIQPDQPDASSQEDIRPHTARAHASAAPR